MEKCIFGYRTLFYKYRFSKYSLLQGYLLEFLPTGVLARSPESWFIFCLNIAIVRTNGCRPYNGLLSGQTTFRKLSEQIVLVIETPLSNGHFYIVKICVLFFFFAT